MGRPRKYANNAERNAAARLRNEIGRPVTAEEVRAVILLRREGGIRQRVRERITEKVVVAALDDYEAVQKEARYRQSYAARVKASVAREEKMNKDVEDRLSPEMLVFHKKQMALGFEFLLSLGERESDEQV